LTNDSGKEAKVSKDEVNLPLVDKLVNELREEVKSGKYGASGEGRIPTTTTLSKKWKTTRSTVYQVLQILQSEGLIRARGTSLVVNYPTLVLEGLTENFERFLRAQGHDVTMENLIEPVVEAMPKEIADLFSESEGVHVVHRMRKQGIPGLPLRLAENWYPVSLAGQFVEAMRTNDRMDVLGAIKEAHGVFIENSQDVVLARIPTSEEAKLLDLVRTEPIVEIRRSNFASDGTPVMYNRIIHVAPHFQFTYKYKVNHWKQ
jgi:DNA-binding GntR family transcriptional regulator